MQILGGQLLCCGAYRNTCKSSIRIVQFAASKSRKGELLIRTAHRAYLKESRYIKKYIGNIVRYKLKENKIDL